MCAGGRRRDGARGAGVITKLATGAGMLESAALALVLAGGDGPADLARLLGVHALASLFVAMSVWASLPAARRAPRAPVLAQLFVQNLFVPGLPVLLRMAHAAGARFRRLLEDAPVNTVTEPEYAIYRDSEGMQTRAGRTRTKLTNLGVSAQERLTALLAIQETPARACADLLRQLLADPVEDIRLLAYGMLDAKEKRISLRILAEEGRLEKAAAGQARFGCHKRIAELYWELAYQRLVQGDMRRYACEQARRHATEALAHDGQDPGLWYLLLRVAIELREAAPAREALGQARALRFPDDQLAPYEAELAFVERRLADIPVTFGRIGHLALPPALATVRNFWTHAR